MKREIVIGDGPPPVVRLCGWHLSCVGLAVGFVRVEGGRVDVCHIHAGDAEAQGSAVVYDPVYAAREGDGDE